VLDVHVDVLELHAELELAGGDLLQDPLETRDDAAGFLLGDDAGLAQHGGMGDACRRYHRGKGASRTESTAVYASTRAFVASVNRPPQAWPSSLASWRPKRFSFSVS